MNYESITAPNSPYHNGLLCWGSLTIDIASTKKLALVICNWHCSFCIAAKPNLGQLDFCIFLFLRKWWENMSRVEGSCSFRLWIPVHIYIYMYLKSSKSHCTCAQNIQFSWSLHSRYVFFRFQLLCFIYGTKLAIWDCYTKFTKRKRKYVCLQASFLFGNPPAPPETLPLVVKLIHALIQCSDNLPLQPKSWSKSISPRTRLLLRRRFLQNIG